MRRLANHERLGMGMAAASTLTSVRAMDLCSAYREHERWSCHQV